MRINHEDKKHVDYPCMPKYGEIHHIHTPELMSFD